MKKPSEDFKPARQSGYVSVFWADRQRLVWASNRLEKAPHETNIFIADWVERP